MSKKKQKSSKPAKKAADSRPTIETPAWLPALSNPRDEEILGAAFCTFTELGFHGATMLEIARRAQASKTTLYERFRDKEGLFQALLEWGASRYRAGFDSFIQEQNRDTRQALIHFGTLLLETSMQAEALALFRIAVAESTRAPQVGRIFEKLSQDALPAFKYLVEKLAREGKIRACDPEEFGETFLSLLRGELYFKALLGISMLSTGEIKAQSRRAADMVLKIYKTESSK